MATQRYDALVAKVREWSNRDTTTALPDTIIQDALDYAADESYRLLEVPALEFTVTYPAVTASQSTDGNNQLAVPQNLSSFIQLRTIDDQRCTSQVYNTKVDLRTLEDIRAEQYSRFTWTRKGPNILVTPPLAEGDVFELHYYRRLPALNAVYNVTPNNFASSLLINLGATEPADNNPVIVNGVTYTSATPLFFAAGTTDPTPGANAAFAAQNTEADRETFYFAGTEAYHWLRDEQEKVLLWGALWHISDYNRDTEGTQLYLQKFQGEIEAINSREKYREASGGNFRIQFNANGLI